MIEHSAQIELRKQLSFCEAYILLENVNETTTHEGLMVRLGILLENTADKRLLTEINSLLSKLKDLTAQDFSKLKQDILRGHVLFPPDYTL